LQLINAMTFINFSSLYSFKDFILATIARKKTTKNLNVKCYPTWQSSKLSDESCDACKPRWGMQLWGDVCIHIDCALESSSGGWAKLKDIWMRWNAICLNNQESYQSHPMCRVLFVHTYAMCFNRLGYWQIFHCDSHMTFFSFSFFASLHIFAVNMKMWWENLILNGGGWN